MIPDQLIPANQTINLIELKEGDSADARNLYTFIHDVEFEIEYASIYGDRWMLSSKKYVPKKLD